MVVIKYKACSLIILLILPVFWASAQKKDLTYYQCAFFETYRAGNMDPWPGLIDEMAKVESTDVAWQTEILNAMYGLVGYQIGQGEKDAARKYIDKADGLL